MRTFYLSLTFLILSLVKLNSQCSETSPNGWTIDLNLNIVDVVTTQAGSACVANIVLNYNINLTGINSLWTLQGQLTCDGASGSSFFNLPNNGGSGTVTSENFSYDSTMCDDIIFNCPIEITINGPGLNTVLVCAPAIVLPVDLVSFDYKLDRSTLTFDWQTNQEINTANFEILSSTDAIDWRTEGKIAAHGNSNQVLDYQYALDAPKFDTYYKLKMIDFDGYTEYSEVLLVNKSKAEEASFDLFPNPAFDYIQIKSDRDWDADQIEIISATTGQIFKAMVGDQNKIDISHLGTGLYFLVIETGQEIKRLNFLKS